VRLCYIISAYKLPAQVVRLVRRLDSAAASFYVHLDKKCGDAVYRTVRDGLAGQPNVHFLKRQTCWWGGFGHVAATLEGLDQLLASGEPFDYVILLTGQDYPIKSRAYIEGFFARQAGTPFIESFALPSPNWTNGGLDRIASWHLRLLGRSVKVPSGRFLLPRRQLPDRLRPFGGSSYWCLPRACAEYVHRFARRSTPYRRFFRYVDVPDELFFQTIIMNSPWASRAVNDNLRYIAWRDPDAASPAVLGVADFHRLRRSRKLFARKFDAVQDSAILDLIDERLIGRA
jgi:hypothetical protein